MGLRNRLIAALTGLAMGFSGAASALAPNTVDLTVIGATGTPGTIVAPSVSFDINGFQFDSLFLDLSYNKTALTFLPAQSTVTLNGNTFSFASLPNFNGAGSSDINGVWHEIYTTSTLLPQAVTGSLLLVGKFLIDPGAAPGVYGVTGSGYVSTGPLVEEPDFSGTANITVTAVPEPELWLLWLGGVGLLAWRRQRRLM